MVEDFLPADWPAPAGVHCLVTTRRGGVSGGAWASFNLGLHVDDEPARVRENRRQLRERLGGLACQWVRQVHGTRVFVPEAGAEPLDEGLVPGLLDEDTVVDVLDEGLTGVLNESPVAGVTSSIEAHTLPTMVEADALYTDQAVRALGILTADCLPVALCDRAGREVAVAHAGWRGLCAGVLENTLARFRAPRDQLLAWLGPAIGPCHFEVGGEVRDAFLAAAEDSTGDAIDAAFQPGKAPGKWMADLYAIARARLRAAGVEAVHGGGCCTYCEPALFYSYRRERVTGRFATVIWRE